MVRRFLILVLFTAANAHAFCGFYVAKGDAKIFNRASQVVLVRDGDRISIDANACELRVEVDDAEMARRRAEWKAPAFL